MISRLRQRMHSYTPGPLPKDFHKVPETGVVRKKASVLIPIEIHDVPEVILTLRSAGLNSHGGEVAWPGGKHDEADETLLATALRETEEEIGLPPDKVEVIGELRPFISRHGLLVTPYVGLIGTRMRLIANPDELDAIFKVPVSWLLEDPRSHTNVIERHKEVLRIPEYIYEGHRIWGLTSMILKELLIAGFDVDMD